MRSGHLFVMSKALMFGQVNPKINYFFFIFAKSAKIYLHLFGGWKVGS